MKSLLILIFSFNIFAVETIYGTWEESFTEEIGTCSFILDESGDAPKIYDFVVNDQIMDLDTKLRFFMKNGIDGDLFVADWGSRENYVFNTDKKGNFIELYFSNMALTGRCYQVKLY